MMLMLLLPQGFALLLAGAVCPVDYTLMAHLNYSQAAGAPPVRLAACEDLRGRSGSLVFVAAAAGTSTAAGGLWPLTLEKRVEFMGMDNATEDKYLSFTKEQVMSSPTDLLGNSLLGIHGHPPRDTEPTLREVQAAIPPIRSISSARICTANRESGRDACFKEDGSAPTWSGTPDPATISSGDPAQKSGEMRIPRPKSLIFDGEGLLGGDLPIIVLNFPLANSSDALWEMTVVPQPNNTGREQPIFMRFIHVNASAAKGQARPASLYFDTYEYNPSLGCPMGSEDPRTLAPDGCANPADFYTAILDQHFFWERTWEQDGRMMLSLPNTSGTDGTLLALQASHGLVLDMITRSDTVWPRYGTAPGYDQAGIGADGFQEIFTASMMASLEWGAFSYAKAILDNQLTYFVSGRGFVRYRGLEMAQTCRMLTSIAQYYSYTRDESLILLHLGAIQGLGDFLNMRYRIAKLGLNGQGSLVPGVNGNGSSSLPIGNDEADMFFGTVVGYRTELPFISIAAEMWRGLRDCGAALAAVAAETNSTAAKQASEVMLTNTAMLERELLDSMARDAFEQDEGSICHPYVAGVPACGMLFANGTLSTASPRDSEAWRSYSEAMYSGILPDQTIAEILEWHQTHGSCGKLPCHQWNDTKSDMARMLNGSMLKAGVPAGSGGDVRNGDQMMTFTVHGWGAGLLQADLIEPFLLQYYALSAHAYTRGSWIAPESTEIDRAHLHRPTTPP